MKLRENERQLAILQLQIALEAMTEPAENTVYAKLLIYRTQEWLRLLEIPVSGDWQNSAPQTKR